MSPLRPRRIPEWAKEGLRVMFVAKHARGSGEAHHIDGNHATYHHEIATVMRGLFRNVIISNRFEDLFDKPDVDFIFSLLNRGGFLNSEMLAPLLATRHGIPFLGASPILRGMADDKHLAKMAARARGIPTAPWAVYRRGAPVEQARCPAGERLVIKPNASSASWGVQDARDWAGVKAAIADIHSQGHDTIVEPFLNGSDVEVAVITVDGEPVILPMMLFEQADPTHLRTYYEKRDLVDRSQKYRLVAFDEDKLTPLIAEHTRNMADEFRPFDYGRFEFRVDLETGTVNFLEVNLQANLWSQKVYGQSAALAGLSHADLIETIVCQSLVRQGLISAEDVRAG